MTLNNIQYIKSIGENTYSLKFKTGEYPVRVNESWIALMCFKYERLKDESGLSECCVCSIKFDSEDEGIHGYIGMIEFSLCQECLNGMRDMCEENYICPHCEKMAGDEDV